MDEKSKTSSVERWLVLSASTIVVGLFVSAIVVSLVWVGYRVYVYQSAVKNYNWYYNHDKQIYDHCLSLGFNVDKGVYPFGLNGKAEPQECMDFNWNDGPAKPSFSLF